LTDKQTPPPAAPAGPLDQAREWYAMMRAGVGNPYNQVPFIRERLADAGVGADALDPGSGRAAGEVEAELDRALVRAERECRAAWARHRRGPVP